MSDTDLVHEYDNDRFMVHEPRALWSVAAIQAPENDATALSGRVQLNKDHFRNTSRWPITLDTVCLSAINYVFRSLAGTSPPNNANDVQNSESIINLIDVFVSAPYSRHVTPRQMRMAALPTEGRDGPSMGQSASASYASALWGVSRWDFKQSLILPKKSVIQFDLSAVQLPNLDLGLSDNTQYFTVSAAFDEVHDGEFGGNNREFTRNALLYSNAAGDNVPFQAVGFTNLIKSGGLFATNVSYPSTSRFSPNDWNSQESGQGGDIRTFSGFSVAIDQIDWDEVVQTFGDPAYPGEPLAPMANRIGVRSRIRNAGSGEWWWRPGAPLSLVTPTMTPAMVYPLPEPITLEPGEQLDVEIQVPVGFDAGGSVGSIQPTYQVGVSLTGYASVENRVRI